MFLAIDVGNTHTVLGLYEGPELQHHWRLQTDPGRTLDEYGLMVRSLLNDAERPSIQGVAIACVVPTMTNVIEGVSRAYLGVEPLVVGPGIKTGMPIFYDNPREVGADRIVNAVAAYERTKDVTIIVDFGTATTFDFVSKKGEYMGGVIAPGLGVASDALFERAAKLYRVELAKPKQVVGRNTINAIQSGLIYGYVALVDGLVERIRKENKCTGRVIGTGGFASLLAPESTTIEEIDEFLTLDGLRLLHERNHE